MNAQAVYKSGARSAATARRLIAATSIAPHVLAATIYDERFIGREVVFCKDRESGSHFYLVASKFVGRFYKVTCENGEWKSSGGRDLQARHMQQIKIYHVARKVARLAD